MEHYQQISKVLWEEAEITLGAPNAIRGDAKGQRLWQASNSCLCKTVANPIQPNH